MALASIPVPAMGTVYHQHAPPQLTYDAVCLGRYAAFPSPLSTALSNAAGKVLEDVIAAFRADSMAEPDTGGI
jgi:hypothetical protein